MIKMSKKIIDHRLIIAFILGIIIAGGGVYAATSISGENITYSNTKSGLSSNNIQGAIDELYETAKTHCPEGHICSNLKQIIDKNPNIVKAYLYDEKDSGTKCITGEESTCKETTCINYSNQDSCPAGTIIKYKVNNSTTRTFYVMFDEGNTMTMYDQRNTTYAAWYQTSDNTKGPITSLTELENATSGWTNVNNQSYALGKSSLSGKGASTGSKIVNGSLSYTNTYTLQERTARARMITLQEAIALGCTFSTDSCPKWFTAVDDNSQWVSTADSSKTGYAYYINHSEFKDINNLDVGKTLPTHAVVEISK